MTDSVLSDWYQRVVATQKGHYLSADHFARLNYWLGMPVMALTTFVGTSVFASLQQAEPEWFRILIGFASVLAAVLASFQTFLGFAERAEKHRVAGAKYGAVGRQLEALIAASTASPEESGAIREKLDALALESPNVPLSIYRRAKMSALEEARSTDSSRDM